MWFAFICTDVEGSLPLRTLHRPAHLARLEILENEGRLLVAGPFPLEAPSLDADAVATPGFSGSLIIADFDNLAEAQHWADDEPFLKAGVYSDVVIKPFRKTLPAN